MVKKYLSSLRDFSLGINDKDSPNIIPDNALVEAQNALLGRGIVSKRHGYQRYSTQLANPITKLYSFYKNNGTKEFLAISNNFLHKVTSASLTPISGALVNNDVKMITYKDRNIQDVVLIADKGKLKVYTGTGVVEAGAHAPSTDELTDPGSNELNNLTNFRAIAMKQDRIYAAAHPTVKNRVSFCHHDPTLGFAVYDYFPATFFFDVAVEDNDEIVELKVFRDALIVLCKRSVWAIYGDGRTANDYQLKKINVPSGCIAPNSVQVVGNYLFYLSDNHVYALYSTEESYVSAEIVSGSIEPLLKSLPLKEQAVATHFENKYYLSFPNGTTLVLDTTLPSSMNKYGAWVKWTNVQASSFINMDGALMFSSADGSIYEFKETIFHDNGQPIEFLMKTKILDFKYEIQTKKIRRMWVIAKQYDGYHSTFEVKGLIDGYSIVDLSGDSDEINLTSTWDESLWDEAEWDFSEIAHKELRLRKKGKSIQLILSNGIVNEPVSIHGLVFEYKVKKP